MQQIDLTQIQPRVRIANHHNCQNTHRWLQRKIIDLQFIYVLRGRLSYQAAGTDVVHIEQDQVICIKPTRLHDLWADSNAAIIAGIHCELSDGSWAAGDYRCDPSPTMITDCLPEHDLANAFINCAAVFNSYGRFVQERCNSICKNIILALAEQWQHQQGPAYSKRMLEMIEFIRQHIHETITRQDLARAFYVSPEHINYLFKKELGMTPSEVINRERCMQAHQLLLDGSSVKEAAYAVGFNDPLFFSKVFKKYFQISPSKVK